MQSIVYISGGALGDLIHQIGIIYEIYGTNIGALISWKFML